MRRAARSFSSHCRRGAQGDLVAPPAAPSVLAIADEVIE
jgi:hypothetical protein